MDLPWIYSPAFRFDLNNYDNILNLIVLNAYKKYHQEHEIDENKIVYMSETEIKRLNRI